MDDVGLGLTRSELDDRLLDQYPELDRLVMFLDRLRSIDPKRRGALVYRIMEVLELTRVRFITRMFNGGQDEFK